MSERAKSNPTSYMYIQVGSESLSTTRACRGTKRSKVAKKGLENIIWINCTSVVLPLTYRKGSWHVAKESC